MGRPDHGAEEKEHDKGFRRESVVGSSDAEKGRGIISRMTVIVTLPTQQYSYLASEPKPTIFLGKARFEGVVCEVLRRVSKMNLLKNLQQPLIRIA